jgi:protein-tyrosine-phosphatase
MGGAIPGPPRAVLFACNLNRVRSPMAAALLRRRVGSGMLIDSCGLDPGDAVDPFAVAVMSEIGVDLAEHQPQGMEPLEGGKFDLVITLTPEADARARALLLGRGTATEHWPIEDPTAETGARDLRVAAYRRVRDEIDRRLATRFPECAARER